ALRRDDMLDRDGNERPTRRRAQHRCPNRAIRRQVVRWRRNQKEVGNFIRRAQAEEVLVDLRKKVHAGGTGIVISARADPVTALERAVIDVRVIAPVRVLTAQNQVARVYAVVEIHERAPAVSGFLPHDGEEVVPLREKAIGWIRVPRGQLVHVAAALEDTVAAVLAARVEDAEAD